MRIGELAVTANVTIQTIRFYEREGLLPKAHRTGAGYRTYEKRDIDRLTLIRSCQDIGFTLKDVKEILELHGVLASLERADDLKPTAQAQLLSAARRRLTFIEDKLKIISKMKRNMTKLVATLNGRQKPICPVSGKQAT